MLRPMGDLSSVFTAAVAAEPDEMDGTALAEALQRMLAAARAAWPAIRVSDAAFVHYVAERVAEEEDPVTALGARCTDDLLLACGCVQGDAAALSAFDEHCLGGLGAATRRIDPSDEFLDEVRQVTRVSLLVSDGTRDKRLTTYRGAGKLRSWVRVGAVRTALELRRKSRPQDLRDEDRLLEAADMDDDPEMRHIKQLYRGEFKSAFAEAMRSLESRERNILRMYLVDGLNIDQIGKVYGVHRATVARWIARSREKLLSETRSRLLGVLRMSEARFDSLMVIVRSHLDLSIERLLDVSQQGSKPGAG